MDTFEQLSFDSNPLFRINHSCNAFNYPLHWHNAVEIIVPIKSTLTTEVSTQTYNLNESDILIIPPGEMHGFSADSGRRIFVHFDLKILDTIFGYINATQLFSALRLITNKNSNDIHSRLYAYLMEIFFEHTRKEPYHEMSITNRILDAIILLERNPNTGVTNEREITLHKRENIARLNECIHFIKTNYRENLTLETAAKIAGFSKFHFSRWFRKQMGISFNDYLTDTRMKKAETLLLTTSEPITHIAFEVGYQNTVTFNRIFKKHYKLTPTTFRLFMEQLSFERETASPL